MKFTFVRSSLDKGAEKSQCGENEGLHCVFLFFGRERISFDCNLDFFFSRRKKSRRRRVLSACLLEDSYIGGKRVVYISTSARDFEYLASLPPSTTYLASIESNEIYQYEYVGSGTSNAVRRWLGK